ncbi:MAG TPA: hypothetical protein VFS34_14130 [Thermoanaerobaculia bacterium]|nr:hypothetical protein [Thermoanaerobaculia bacterium]
MHAGNRTWTSLLVLALNIPLWTTGCGTVTTDLKTTRHAPGAGTGTGAFNAAIFDHERDIAKNALTANRVESTLYREDPGGPVAIKQTAEPSFEVTDLPPGRYRLRVAGWRDGNASSAPSATRQKKFTIAPATRVQANVVLNDYGPAISGGSVVLIAIGIALVVALASSWSAGGDSTKGIKFDRTHATPMSGGRAVMPCSVESKVACPSR